VPPRLNLDWIVFNNALLLSIFFKSLVAELLIQVEARHCVENSQIMSAHLSQKPFSHADFFFFTKNGTSPYKDMDSERVFFLFLTSPMGP